MKILYVCGVAPEYPAPLHPLPPLDSGSPHSLIFRLVEHLANKSDMDDLSITVISAITHEQIEKIHNNYSKASVAGDYRWSIIPPAVRRMSLQLSKNIPWSTGVLQRIFGAYSLQACYYAHDIKKLFRQILPDLVVLDTAPQYIRTLARFVPLRRLIFYCRADMGASRRFLHLPKLVLAVDTPLGEWIQKINPNVSRFAVIHDSLPPTFLEAKRNPDRIHATNPVILFVGRIAREKGLEYLIQAFSRVHAIHSNARLVIVGAEWTGSSNCSMNETAYGRSVRALADELVPDLVEWKGWLKTEDLAEEYKHAYMAVYPSTWVEGFGMVASEAMAFGVPVIASNRPGFRAQLEKGGGLLVDDPKDTEALANAILSLLEDPLLAENLGRQGFDLAHEYTVERTGQDFIKAIKSIDLHEKEI